MHHGDGSAPGSRSDCSYAWHTAVGLSGLQASVDVTQSHLDFSVLAANLARHTSSQVRIDDVQGCCLFHPYKWLPHEVGQGANNGQFRRAVSRCATSRQRTERALRCKVLPQLSTASEVLSIAVLVSCSRDTGGPRTSPVPGVVMLCSLTPTGRAQGVSVWPRLFIFVVCDFIRTCLNGLQACPVDTLIPIWARHARGRAAESQDNHHVW